VTWTVFEGRVTPMPWGRAVYSVLPLPDAIVVALGATRRVEGEINDQPVNLAITRAPVVPFAFLWAGQSLLDRIGITPGDPLEVRLRPAPDDQVEMPPDVASALSSAIAWPLWEGLSPGRKRGELYRIETAKRAETRAKRIAALVRTLAASD
jgi:Bacteriocin-protection, YdeI or OmpD-Associated